MYSVCIDDANVFHTFARVSNASSIDVVFTDNRARFISNSSEVFSILVQKCDRTLNAPDVAIHTPISFLDKLVVDGFIDFDVKENEVDVFFKSSTRQLLYKTTITRQEAFISAYQYKIDVLAEVDFKTAQKTFNLKDLGPLTKIVSAMSSLVSVNNGVACVLTDNNSRVYRAVKSPFNFSLNSVEVKKLSQVNTQVVGIHEFVSAKKGNLLILVRQVNGEDNAEYNAIINDEEDKSCYISDISFSGLNYFLRKIKPENVHDVKINVETRECIFKSDSQHFSVPFVVSNEKRASKTTFTEFSIPLSVLLAILQAVKESIFTVEKHKNYVLLKHNDFVLFV